jgi:hypothetical protein
MRGSETGILFETLRASAPTETALGRSLLHAGLAVGAAAIFGACLGSYSLDVRQIFASALKTPLLLLGTGFVCFPSWYLLQFTTDQPPTLAEAFRIQVTALLATASVWAALSPPLLVLSLSLQHYDLARVIAVVVAAAGGLVGLRRFAALGGGMRPALMLHYLVFGAVGAQLAWILRPFVGSPFEPFQLLRSLGS